ncbi:Gfo/Idh/MocA family protein [Phnomibacter ginsenosidimutans]|uniref:Gfo/Idh/MocA family oxidoreductase n=1 Tax=Phnomibacter ginsenosidimutans TaxID=2676868 RepID=A0A6I6GKJ3_9BACT|nr:Gfo/Idh/MocA family oxidoreductase [Phnomibacter ginsenosidimutans]QGW27422.1 gfo/Idh/MocA family oxidoreductase [Phnomibacter ginsenosidimutans]
MKKSVSRRRFVQQISLSAAAAGLLQTSAIAQPFESSKKIRLGFIGVGARGRLHMSEMMKRSDTEINAIADPDASSIAKALAVAKQQNKKEPAVYSKGDEDFLKLLQRDDIDAVIIASPWSWHLPQSLAAMKAGIAVGLEVSGADRLQDCWDFIDTYEETKTPIMIMENVCYRRDIMAILNMVQQDRFGELLHLQGGYQHDLRAELFNTESPCCNGVEFGEKALGSAKWRTEQYVKRNGEIYPTHQLGPIATMININRGNRLTKLSSIASKARGMNRYVAMNPKGGPNHPNAKLKFNLGDIVTTQIQTVNGETIVLTHDTSSPRPYNLGFKIQGTNGLWQDFHEGEPDQGMIFFEDKSPKHTWENPKKYIEQYDHPLWQKYAKQAEGAGHGGMDFFVANAFIESLKNKVPFPLDIYDLATWYSITPLSEASIALGGQLVEIPDFTRGKWKTRAPFASFNSRSF